MVRLHRSELPRLALRPRRGLFFFVPALAPTRSAVGPFVFLPRVARQDRPSLSRRFWLVRWRLCRLFGWLTLLLEGGGASARRQRMRARRLGAPASCSARRRMRSAARERASSIGIAGHVVGKERKRVARVGLRQDQLRRAQGLRQRKQQRHERSVARSAAGSARCRHSRRRRAAPPLASWPPSVVGADCIEAEAGGDVAHAGNVRLGGQQIPLQTCAPPWARPVMSAVAHAGQARTGCFARRRNGLMKGALKENPRCAPPLSSPFLPLAACQTPCPGAANRADQRVVSLRGWFGAERDVHAQSRRRTRGARGLHCGRPAGARHRLGL